MGWEDPLKKEVATHFSILDWEIPWTEEPGRQQSMVSQRVRHNLVTKPHIFIIEYCSAIKASLVAQLVKNLPAMRETCV